MYRDKTCCKNDFDMRAVSEKLESFANNGCSIDKDCLSNIEMAICAYCSPSSNNFITNGTVHFCDHFVEQLYEQCRSSHYRASNTEKCEKIEDKFTEESFLELFGIQESDVNYCFNELAYDPFPVGAIIGICVGGALLLAGLITLISLCGYKSYKKKHPKEDVFVPPTEMMTLDLDTNPMPSQVVTTEVAPSVPDDSISSVTIFQAF